MDKGLLADELHERLKKKPEPTAFVDEVIAHPEIIPLLFEIIGRDKGSVKFYCEKVVRMIGEQQPLLVYPYFEDLVSLLDSQNSFIKWGAIITLSNLVSVDDEGKFSSIFDKYLALVNSDSMITAVNVIENAWKIVVNNPEYEKDLTNRLLAVSGNTYLNKGKPSQECKNIVLGNVIDCFDRFYSISGNKKAIIEFVRGQRSNTRRQVAKKAEAFLRKYD